MLSLSPSLQIDHRRISRALAVIAAIMAVLVGKSIHAADKPLNVVLIVGDDMGWTDYSFMGHEVVKTPNIDRLAAEGAVFANGYVPTSLCRASLATILTGLYASTRSVATILRRELIERTCCHS